MSERTKVNRVLTCLGCAFAGMSFARVLMPAGDAFNLIWFGSGTAGVIAAFYQLVKR
ncbi:hypothetical protein QZM64_39935 [Burkholderia cepacia]|uniref:hypothetical protein n=1 Tax=Burkholderia cepacia complex TaxID=87882 RepID=UPI0015E2B853|nr:MULTISPECIES: hypothetical protein [Burkholderia cepacia complex]MDN7445342.1 hypothetical protein [Burkholderia cepacia]